MRLEVNNVKQWLIKTNEKIQKNKQYLTKLDQAVGDGDHGINMARGFEAVVQRITNKRYEHVSDILKDTAMTVMSKVGGAAGPLYGTAFLRLSLSFKGKETIDYSDLVKGLEDAVKGIKQRGRSTEGEKTLVDVWDPVVNQMLNQDDVNPEQMTETAKMAIEKTKEMVATKGRAAYFKEKSIGHIDPGAMSSYYVISALADVLKGGHP